MIDLLTDEAFLKPALIVITLIMMLILLRRINKIVLVMGILVLLALYLLNNRPDWIDAFWKNFQY